MHPRGQEYTIGVLSQYSGVNIETIRYYEKIGIMPSPPRSDGGYRLYRDSQLRRLSFIRRGRQLGFSLKDIRRLLGIVDDKSYTCAQVQQVALEQLDTIRRKIIDLQKLETVLNDMAADCSGGLVPDCPVIDSLFEQNGDNNLILTKEAK